MSERADQAADIVQAAAIEAIKAMKAFLDVAESVVRDPSIAASVGKAFTDAFRPPRADDEQEHDEEQATGGFRRIDLSD